MNNPSTIQTAYGKRALLLTLFLIMVAIGSILWIFSGRTSENALVADIYQNGNLLESIPLTSVEEPYTMTVTGDNHATNVIEVRNGSIGIISASCPDKICVHQGFISNSRLPITCLPNRLVIQIRSERPIKKMSPDIISY